MPYLNLRLRALFAAGLLLLGVPSVHAQDAPATGTIRGDVDGDGRVTRADAEAVRAFLVRGTLPEGRSILPAGDANGDGRVTAADAALISRYVAGVDVSRFPVGRAVDGTRVPTTDETGMLVSELECEMTVSDGTTTCRSATPGANGARADIILAAPLVTVTGTKVVSNGEASNPDTSTVTYTLTNKIPQPIGTADGTTLHPNGSRMFFTAEPRAKNSSGTVLTGIQVRFDPLPDSATFTSAQGATFVNKKYVQFNKVLPLDSAVMAAPVRFVYDDPAQVVNVISVSVRVATPVQFEHGWATVAPATVPVLAPGGTTSLTGSVYNQVGEVQGDGITWSSSNTAVATVNATTGEVTAVDEGTATITATSTVNGNRKGTRVVTVDKFPTVTSTTPTNGATEVLVTDNIVINFSEAVNVTGSAFTLECPAGSSQAFTVSGNGTSAITLNPDADLPAAVTCTVVVDGNEVTDVDTNDGPDKMAGNYSFSFETAIQAVPDVFGTTTTGNVRINSASTSPVFSVTANDKTTGATTITFAGWNAVAGKTMGGGDVVMDTEGAGMGTFTYNPPAGFEGTDSLEYTITSGTASSSAKVALPVSGMIWFVNNGGAACTSRANGCGRLTNPYSSLAAFNAENNGTGNNPAAGDNIFAYESATTYTGPVTLLANQKLIGQDAGASLSTITGITPATGSDALPSMNPGANTVTIAGASGGVVLGADNLLRGLSLATTGGTALSGTGFGTPTIAEVPISATGGAALSLDNGTLNSTFPSVSSTNSTGRGISLTNVNGSPTFTAGSISGAAQAALFVSGGNVGFTFPGNIGQANNAPLVDVQGSHGGTLIFSGALSATNGTGLQFNAAQGTYTFSGTTTLNGGDAGVDITNGSTGTFNFNASTQITNPSGTGLNVYGSAPALVSYAGSITKNGTNTGRLVEIGEMTGGTVTFPVGSTLSSTSTAAAATGISLSNADGTVNFNGTTTLNGGDAGVDVLSGTGGTIVFSANTSITNPSGTALNVNASTPNLTFNGNITKNGTSAGRLVDVTGQTGGGTVAANNTITFQNGTLNSTSSTGTGILLSDVDGTVSFNGTTTLNGGDAAVDVEGGSGGVISFASGAAITNPTNELIRVVNSAPTFTYAGSFTRNNGAGAGILAQNNTGGTFTFSGATQTLNTGASAAVSLLSNTGATIDFTGGALAITTAGGAGFAATGGGKVTVTGNANTVSTGSGTAVNISNTEIHTGGVTFRSVSANGAANGIVLNTTGTTAGLTVTGNGSAGTGGTIQNTTGAGISLTNTLSPTFGRMVIQNTGSHGISGSLVTNFSLTNSTVTNSGTTEVAGRQESNISFYQNAGTGTEKNVTGTVTITGNTLNNALHHGINITQYDGTISSLNISNNTFTSATASSGSTNGATTSHGSAISINPIGSGATIASVTSATISNNTITGFPGNAGILFIGGNTNVGGPSGSYGTVADSITIQSNRIRGHSAANRMNTQAVNIAVGARGTGFFRVLDNGTAVEPITNMAGHAITVSALGQATVGIRLTNNRIVANNIVGSQGISMGVDTAADFATTAVLNATVNSNTISATHGSGIFALATRRGTMNAKILNNSVAAPASGTYGIQLVAATTLANTGTGCFSISGNTTAGGVNGGTTFPGIGLRRQSGAATAPNTFGIVGLPGGSTATPSVENYVNSLNTSTSGTFGTGGTALISATTGFTSCSLSF